MEEEIWKQVIGFEELFLISSHGRLKSIRKSDEKILKQTILKTGYYSVATKIGGRRGKNYCFKIHRLVAEAFLETPTDENILKELNSHYGKIPVNHKDANKLNNHYSNLEWCTYKNNTKHASESGLLIHPPHTSRKLSVDDVKYIKSNYIPNHSLYSGRRLAENFKVSHDIISKIINNETYKEVV